MEGRAEYNILGWKDRQDVAKYLKEVTRQGALEHVISFSLQFVFWFRTIDFENIEE